MTTRKIAPLAIALIALLVLPAGARASFHLMQIESVKGGVCGDFSAQAVQLRMRAAGQNFIAGSSLVAHDAAGLNPVVLIEFLADVAAGALGDRILVVSSAMAASQPGVPTADFTMTNLIPPSYLAAGRLTFELPLGTVYWSLSWGGAAYTGPTTGLTFNDADGDFGPSAAGALPAATSRALHYPGPASGLSTTNAADYALTSAEATFTNNAGASGAVSTCLFGDSFETGDTAFWSVTVP